MIDRFRFKIPSAEINQLPLYRYEGDLVLVDDQPDVAQAVDHLAKEALIGFDTETRPAFRKGESYRPSLLQLASAERVYLFHLHHITLSNGLLDILSDPKRIKTGVAVRDDIIELQKMAHFEPAGFVDLGLVAQKAKLETHGLRNLAAKFLGVRISKSARCTNWACKRLSPQQLDYAATDAWISREIHLHLQALDLV